MFHSTRLSRRGEIPARGATSSSASHWCLHHEVRHPSPPKPHKREQPPSSASAAPREPRREQAAVAHRTSGEAGLKEEPIHPLADKTVSGRDQRFGCEEAKHQDLVGDKERQKGQLRPKSSQLLVLKAPLKTVHKSHAADLHCCAGICPLPIGCWLPQSHFLLPLAVSISLCLLLNSFLHLSHSQHFLPPASDLISASLPPIVHPPPCSTLSPSLPLLI